MSRQRSRTVCELMLHSQMCPGTEIVHRSLGTFRMIQLGWDHRGSYSPASCMSCKGLLFGNTCFRCLNMTGRKATFPISYEKSFQVEYFHEWSRKWGKIIPHFVEIITKYTSKYVILQQFSVINKVQLQN